MHLPGNKVSAPCALCGRAGVSTTVHHLIPREMGGRREPTALLCHPCHKQLHALYTNEELAARLSSIAALQADDQIGRYLKWIRKQPPQTIPRTRKSRAVRGER
jgi:5-methylcytosine-specific restriction enzyme A